VKVFLQCFLDLRKVEIVELVDLIQDVESMFVVEFVVVEQTELFDLIGVELLEALLKVVVLKQNLES